jgi:hypothetical protein
MANESLGSAWYDLGLRDTEFRTKAQAAERTLVAIGTKANSLSGIGPDKLATSLGRAVREADDARAALEKLSRSDNLDPAKARKYADALTEINIEADQLGAELRQLQAADPRFNTPELARAATELDRVGREADQTAGQLNQMKGVRADTHLERVAQEAHQAAGGLEKAGRSTDGLMGKLISVKGALAALGLVIGAQQILGFFNDAIGAASDLNESIAKVNVVFGDASAEVRAWAETMAESFGISEQKALEAAGTYGNLFTAFGMGQRAAQGMSTALVELAADLASFNNTSIDDALLALRSGLSGETEPLKRYGIAIDDARMRTELARQGFTNLGATLTPLQKTTAAYALIMQDSANAQGDVARSSENFAMQQKFLEAALEEVTAEIGQELLPIMLELAQAANDDLVPALRVVVETLGDTGEAIDDALEAVARFHDFIGGRMGNIERIMESMGVSYLEARDAVKTANEEMGLSAQELADRLEAGLPTTVAEVTAAVDEGARAWEARYRQMYPVVEEIVTATAALPRQRLEAEYQPIRAAAYQSQVELAKGLMDAQNLPQVAFDAAMQMLEEEMTATEEAAHLSGLQTQLELALGIAAAEGKDATVAAINAALAVITDRLDDLPGEAEQWGYNSALGLAAGMDRGYGVVVDSAGNLAGAVRGQVGIQSEPEDPDSPLRGITTWGGNIAGEIADDMLGAVGEVWDAAHTVGDAIEDGLQQARASFRGLFAPDDPNNIIRRDVVLDPSQIRDLRGIQTIKGFPTGPGFVVPQYDPDAFNRAGAPHLTGGAAPLAFNQTLNIQGLVRAETPVDIGIQARRGAMLGISAASRGAGGARAE